MRVTNSTKIVFELIIIYYPLILLYTKNIYVTI